MKPGWFVRIWCILVGTVLVAPLFIVAALSFTGLPTFKFPPQDLSFRWYESFFGSAEWKSSFWFSLKLALTVGLTSSVLGTLAAVGMVRVPKKFSVPAMGLILVPLIVPPIVAAVGVYKVYLESGLLGTFLGFVLINSALTIPFVFVTVTASLSNYDPTLELAATNLGANRFRTLRSVTLPLILPGVASGFVFAFAQAFDEVIVSQFIATPGQTPLAVMMWTSISRGLDPTIAAVSTLIIGAVIVAIALIVPLQQLSRKRNHA